MFYDYRHRNKLKLKLIENINYNKKTKIIDNKEYNQSIKDFIKWRKYYNLHHKYFKYPVFKFEKEKIICTQ